MVERVIYVLLAWNLIVLLIYGWDKLLAKMNQWRIPEAVLIWLAFLLGGPGALMGMFLFNHKTQKWKFRICVPLAVLLWTFVMGYVCYYWPK